MLGKLQIYLHFLSLIRTFDMKVEGRLHLGKIQINLVFRSVCTTFDLKVEGTLARKIANIFAFSLTYSYLCTLKKTIYEETVY